MKKNFIKLIALMMACIMSIIPMASCGETVNKKPDIAVADAIDKTIELAGENETLKTAEKLGKAGSMEMSWELSDFITSVISAASGGIGLSLSSKIALQMKGDVDMDKGESSGKLGLMLNDAEFIGLDIYGNEEAMAIGSDILLDGKVLGVSIKSFTELLDSVAGNVQIPENTSSVEFRLTPEQIEELGEALESYYKLALEKLYENSPAERTEETLTIGNKQAKAVVFTNSFGEKEFNALAKSVYEAYKADTKTRQLIESILLNSSMTESDLAEFYASLEEELNDTEFDLETSVTLKIAIHKNNGNILLVSIGDSEENIELILPVDPAKPDYAKLTVPDAAITFEAAETDTEKSFTLVVNNQNEDIVKLEGKLTKETDSYTVSLNAGGKTISATGSFKLEKNSLLFAVDTVSVDDMTIKVGFSISFTAGKANVTPLPEYTDVTKMTETEMGELGNTLMANLADLIPMLPKDIQTIITMIMMG